MREAIQSSKRGRKSSLVLRLCWEYILVAQYVPKLKTVLKKQLKTSFSKITPIPFRCFTQESTENWRNKS